MFKKRIISLAMALLMLVVTSLSATALSAAETNYLSVEITQDGEMTIRGNLFGEWLGANVALVILKPDAANMTPQVALESHPDLVEQVIQTTTNSYGKFTYVHTLKNPDLIGEYTVMMSYRNTETLEADRTVVCNYDPVVGLFANAHIDTNGIVTVWGNAPRMDVDTVDITVKRIENADGETLEKKHVYSEPKVDVVNGEFMFHRVLNDTSLTGVHEIVVSAGGKSVIIKANYFGAYSKATSLEKTHPDTHPLQLFVSPNGNEFGTGSEADPFKSLQDAVKLIEKIDINEDVNVFLRAGNHYLTSTLELNGDNTFSNGRKLTFTSYPGERATIHGGKVITGWKQDKDNNGVYYADVELDDFRELYVNGELATRARTETTYNGIGWYNNSGKYYNDSYHYADNTNIGEIAPGALHRHDMPNEGGTTADSHGFRGGLVLNATGELQNIAKWRNQEDIEIVSIADDTSFSYHRIMATDVITKNNPSITNKNGNTETLSGTIPILLFNSAASYGSTDNMPNYAWKYGNSFYMENAYELLNSEGEWYYDNDADRLYYMPESGVNMNTAVIEVPQVEELITITGTSSSDKVSNVIFRDLDIGYATWRGVNEIGGYAAMQAGNVLTAGMNGHTPGAIILNYTDSIDFIGCTIKNIGSAGIELKQGATNTDITDNEIYNIGASAVSVGRTHHNYLDGHAKDTDGVEGEALCTDTNILRNDIHDIAWQYTSNPGIWSLYTQRLDVSYNRIDTTAYSGISVGWGWDSFQDSTTCRENTISYNHISNVMLVQGIDGAPIYTLGNQPETIIHHNYLDIDNELGYGIYLDEGSNYIHAYENVVDIAEDLVNKGANWLRFLKKDCRIYNNYSTTDEDAVNVVHSTSVEALLNFNTCVYDNTYGLDIMQLDAVKAIVAEAGIHGIYLGGGAVMSNPGTNNSKFLTTDGSADTVAYFRIKNYDATDIETDRRFVIYEGKRMKDYKLETVTIKGNRDEWYTIPVDTSFYNSNTITGAPRYKLFFWAVYDKVGEYLPLLKSVELYN